MKTANYRGYYVEYNVKLGYYTAIRSDDITPLVAKTRVEIERTVDKQIQDATPVFNGQMVNVEVHFKDMKECIIFYFDFKDRTNAFRSAALMSQANNVAFVKAYNDGGVVTTFENPNNKEIT